jgi:serine/threonine protein kinase
MNAEPLSIDAVNELPAADQDRLACILDDYLKSLENGTPITPEELLKRHPDDADYLRTYLSGLEIFHAVAQGQTRLRNSSVLVGRRAGQSIGDFELIREIGRGGMGVVYEAVQGSLKRRVALKILPLSVGHDPKQIARFKNEAQAAAQLQHPNIVPVFAIGEEDGVHYYAMQLVEGQSLAAMVRRRSTEHPLPADSTVAFDAETICGPRLLPPSDQKVSTSVRAQPVSLSAQETREHIDAVAKLAVQAARALHAAHEYGVIHRDVKPSNLLADAAGKLWITDFGLARCREGAGLTQSGDVLGTVRYMSPEQAHGRGAIVDQRADVYSLGVTLYELATFVHPAENASDVELFLERMRVSYKPPRHWNRHIPADFETIVLKSMAELPEDRYATAEALANDLQRFLEGRPIEASRPNRTTRLLKWSRRRRRSLYAVAATLALAMAGLAVGALMLAAQKEETIKIVSSNLQDATRQIDRNTQLGEDLAHVPGAEEVRRKLYEQNIEWYSRHAQQAERDPALADDLIVTYSKIAGLNAQMGDGGQALQFHQDAERILENLAAANPGNPAYLRNLALCKNNRGLALSGLGRTREALDVLLDAERRQTVLLADDPNSRQVSAGLAATCSNLGLVLAQLGNRAEAVKKLKRAVAIQGRLASEEPKDLSAGRSLASTYNNLAAALANDNATAAADSYRHAIDIQRQLLAMDKLNTSYQSELARSYNNLGYLLSTGHRWREAEECYREALVLQESLAADVNASLEFILDAAASLNNLGMVECSLGRFKEAEDCFRKAIDRQASIAAKAPGDFHMLSDLGGMYNNLAQLLDKDHREREAAPLYRKAIRSQREALAAAGDNAAIRELLAKHYFNYAMNLGQRRKFDAARKAALERQKLAQQEPERLYSVAEQLTWLSEQIAAAGGAGSALEGQCLDGALQSLQMAVRAGLPTARLDNRSLASLAGRAEFKQWRESKSASMSAVRE